MRRADGQWALLEAELTTGSSRRMSISAPLAAELGYCDQVHSFKGCNRVGCAVCMPTSSSVSFFSFSTSLKHWQCQPDCGCRLDSHTPIMHR